MLFSSADGSFWYLFLVGLLWGCTNPLMKAGSKDINKAKGKTRLQTFASELNYLARNWKYLLPLLLNQLGSILYYFTLQSSRISFCVPLANSFSLIFTALTSWFLGEKNINRRIFVGIIFTIIGIGFHLKSHL